MDDVGGPDMLGDFNGRARKLAEAFGVVRKIAAGSAVDSVAVEVGGIVDEKIADAVEESTVGDGGKTQALAQRMVRLGMTIVEVFVPR